ncbi:unannotated protein [freshwater metagenome]|uniref:Unannotated protein n=1 Tax=freshwater metagenome TaxID=449393 RepID=A0A6J6KFT1_9ZZZZ
MLTACGGAEKAAERPLTSDEASVLAEVLSRNYEAQGASFSLAAQASSTGGTITLEGDVDWINHQGGARVVGGASPHPVSQVWWSKNVVAERRPTLDSEVARVLPGDGSPLLARSPDTSSRRLDQLIAIVMGLASQTPENAQLILQTEGSAFVRSDELRGKPVLVLRYGQRTLYWLDEETKNLMRFEGTDSTTRFPVVIDFFVLGPKALQVPQGTELVDLAKYNELLNRIPVSP